MVLESTEERIIVGDLYGDLPLGLYIVRGENVVLMAEIVRKLKPHGYLVVNNTHTYRFFFVWQDDAKELQLTANKILKKVDLETILDLQKKERDEREEQLKQQRALLKQKGMTLDESENFG